MHPLTRQPTPASVLSYWSDRNSAGPTISLHAAAKPLMRFLYHREALDFIRRCRSAPLSSEDMQIFSSYLVYKYVSLSTKTAILKELQKRVEAESDACAVADSFGPQFDGLLSSPDAEVRRRMCSILKALAQHETAVPATLRGKPCNRLVLLLRDEWEEVSTGAAQALYTIAKWPEGAQASVDAKVLDYLGDFMDHRDYWVPLDWSWNMLGQLARQGVTAKVAVGHLVSMLRDEKSETFAYGSDTLDWAVTSPDGAQAVSDGTLGDCLAKLLESPRLDTRRGVCSMLERLTRSRNSALTGLCIRFCPCLVTLLRDDSDSEVTATARHALLGISASPAGAQAAVDAGVLEYVSPIRRRHDLFVPWKWIWRFLEQLACHQNTVRSAVGPTVWLFRRSKNPTVIARAVKVLHQATTFPEGIEAAVAASVLECAPALLRLERPELQDYARAILEQLLHQEATARATVAKAISLLRSADPEMVERAAQVLYFITSSAQGMRAFLNANMLESVVPLLDFANRDSESQTDDWTHQLSSPTLLTQLGVLLRHETSAVVEGAAKVLTLVATTPDGARSVVDANVLDYMAELLEYPEPGVQLWMCELLAKLAWHDSTRDAVLCVNPCMRLVSLLSSNPIVRQGAVRILAGISESQTGIAAVAATDFLAQISLIPPSDREVQWYTGIIVTNLARYNPAQL
ncbi:armadillo-type protein [Mycena latifolia]|nr:armadillo-type protein [Mycena latifolia]